MQLVLHSKSTLQIAMGRIIIGKGIICIVHQMIALQMIHPYLSAILTSYEAHVNTI
jgi:hypothetical protein